MSKKRELEQLIAQARAQGFVFEMQRSGHWKAWNPNALNGRFAKISASPRSDRGVTDARVKLQRIGFVPARPPKPKDRKEVKVTVRQVVAEQKEEEMPKVGEIAEFKSVVTTNSVKNEIPMAAYVVWQAVRTRIQTVKNAKMLKDIEGDLWYGRKKDIIDELWPDLPSSSYTRLGVYLCGSKNMVCLVKGRSESTSTWWISRSFSEVTESQARSVAADWWTAEPANFLNKYVPDSDGVFRCPKCSYSTERLTSFNPHMGKNARREHPNDVEGGIQCRFCTDIMPTYTSIREHQRRYHTADTGLAYCLKCKDYTSDDAAKHRGMHNAQKFHPANSSSTAEESKPAPETAVSSTQSTTEIKFTEAVNEPTPVQINEGSDEIFSIHDAEAYMQRILRELSSLREQVQTLSADNLMYVEENERYRADNLELQGRIDKTLTLLKGVMG